MREAIRDEWLRECDRRDERRARRQTEIERIEAIDQLADRLLTLSKYADTPATQVWDIAADLIDKASRHA